MNYNYVRFVCQKVNYVWLSIDCAVEESKTPDDNERLTEGSEDASLLGSYEEIIQEIRPNVTA